jgi:hypothetical protein
VNEGSNYFREIFVNDLLMGNLDHGLLGWARAGESRGIGAPMGHLGAGRLYRFVENIQDGFRDEVAYLCLS